MSKTFITIVIVLVILLAGYLIYKNVRPAAKPIPDQNNVFSPTPTAKTGEMGNPIILDDRSTPPDQLPPKKILPAVEAEIANSIFSPAIIRTSPDRPVKWTNRDSISHTIIIEGQPPSPNIAPGETFEFRLTVPGVYAYHCGLHPTMTGQIEIGLPQ